MKILSLSGFVPEQIADTVRFIQYKGTVRISHYCGYAADYISQVLEDTSIDGAVFPRSCDSCRILPEYLSEKDNFIYQLHIPARTDSFAAGFFASCIKDYKEAIERHYGILLDNIKERAELVNKRNEKLAAIYENIAGCSYKDYLDKIHTMLTQPLKDQAIDITGGLKKPNKPVYVVGSFMTNILVINAIEKAGLTILGDNITESKRLFSAPAVDIKGDVYLGIANSILQNRLSPTQNNFADIIKADLNEIKRKAIKGVIFVTQKYCEPYDYLFVCYKRILDENNIPTLRIVLSELSDYKRAETAIEAFSDII